jgi:ABC-type multidrug transport system fused ATPase/permease subunit
MAARPSSYLQRKPAAPFDLSAAFSIRGEGRALELSLFRLLAGSTCRRPAVVHFAARQSCYSPPHVAVIDVHSFGFTYPGAQRPAVRDVAFSVEPGEIFGFLGPSGSGLALVFTTWLFDRRLLRRG